MFHCAVSQHQYQHAHTRVFEHSHYLLGEHIEKSYVFERAYDCKHAEQTAERLEVEIGKIFGVGRHDATTVRGFCQYGKWHDIEVEDEVTAFFTYKNGATGVFITTTGEAPGVNRLEISGTKGRLVCENFKLFFIKNEVDSQEYSKTSPLPFTPPKTETIEVELDGKNEQHAGIINNFTNAILGIEEQFVEGVEGIKGVELMNAIELSGWQNGAEIILPVDEDLYLEELNKRRATSRLKDSNDDKVADTSGSFGVK